MEHDNSDLSDKKVRRRSLIIGGLFLVLLVFSIVFAVELHGRNSLGDVILMRLGLKPWSGDNGGFHYTFLYSLFMFIIGYLGATYFLRGISPRFTRRLPLILFVFFLLLPSISDAVVHTVKGFSGGLNAIEYDRQESKCDYETDGYGNLLMTASLKFHNYSNKEVSISVKLLPDEFLVDELLTEDMITAIIAGTNDPIVMTLQPHTEIASTMYFRTRVKEGVTNLKGSMAPLDIIIFNEEEEKSFIRIP